MGWMVRGSNPGRARFSAPVQTGPGAHPASCTMGTRSFLGVKSGWAVTLTPHPLLVPWSRKSRAIPLLLLWAVQPVQSLSASTRVHFTLPFMWQYGVLRCVTIHFDIWDSSALKLVMAGFCKMLVPVYRSEGKSRGVVLWARSGPEGSWKLRFRDFMTTAQDGVKVVILTHRPPLPPVNAPVTHFC
jgi:hypothetical protein